MCRNKFFQSLLKIIENIKHITNLERYMWKNVFQFKMSQYNKSY